jgi:acyl-CoA reductase-like NAD-dependent aldehyde dehydrogenase
MATLLNRRSTSSNNFSSVLSGTQVSDQVKLDLFNPVTGHKRGTVTNASSETVQQSTREACAGFQVWKDYTPALRSLRLLEFVTELENNSVELAKAESNSTGKPLAQSLKEVAGAIDVFRFYAGAARTMQTQSAGTYIPDTYSMVMHEPVGCWGVILPWNYPMMMLAWRIAPILAAGNTAIVKPALSTPDTAVMVAEIAARILPNVLHVLTGDETVGQALVISDIDGIAFTGSVNTGQSIAKARPDLPVSLELGGNGACIILPDAPWFTARKLVEALIYNAGQSCAAASRIITVGDCSDFENKLIKEIRNTKASKFGPLNNINQKERLAAILANSSWNHRHQGTCDADGYHVPAQVYWVSDNSSAIIQEEVFAPVFTVQRVATISEAITLANSTEQALSNSVWTSDIENALRIASSMQGGESWINCHLAQSPELPHSGRKQSGTGVDLSAQALNEYTKVKTITVGFENG